MRKRLRDDPGHVLVESKADDQDGQDYQRQHNGGYYCQPGKAFLEVYPHFLAGGANIGIGYAGREELVLQLLGDSRRDVHSKVQLEQAPGALFDLIFVAAQVG